VRKLRFSVKRHEERLAKWTWLAGPTYTLADVNTYSMTAAMRYFFSDFVNEKTTPRTLEWLRRMNERPGVKAALALARRPPRR
jgi:glutathione S-transferase